MKYRFAFTRGTYYMDFVTIESNNLESAIKEFEDTVADTDTICEIKVYESEE